MSLMAVQRVLFPALLLATTGGWPAFRRFIHSRRTAGKPNRSASPGCVAVSQGTDQSECLSDMQILRLNSVCRCRIMTGSYLKDHFALISLELPDDFGSIAKKGTGRNFSS